MRHWMVIVLAVAGVSLGATEAMSAGVAVKTKTIKQAATGYTISIAYPQTGNATIDKELLAFAKQESKDFVKVAADNHSAGEAPYELVVTYEIGRNDATGFGVLFTHHELTGGAHGNTSFATFNYMMPDAWRVYLPEVFGGANALAKISALSIADLQKQGGVTGTDDASDLIASGAGAAWPNFENFILKPTTLDLHFEPYQVAAFIVGSPKVTIKLSQLKAYARPDWKAPAPSFACGKAATPIEKTICSDVALARLDRAVTESYQASIAFADTDADKAVVKAAQRDWLATRDQQCATGKASCLSSAYDARLKDLDSPQ